MSAIDGGSGGNIQPLRNRLSLWLELLAVLALCWWLCDPHLATPSTGRHTVIVIDDHRRLQLLDDQGISSATHLREALRSTMADMDAAERVTLIQSGNPPRVLAGPLTTPAQGISALAQWQPSSDYHAYTQSVQLAAAMQGLGAAQQPAAAIWAGDVEPAELSADWGLVLRGSKRGHAGFAAVHSLAAHRGLGLGLVVEAFAQEQERRLDLFKN